jgi:hypothetical protein
MSLVLNWIDGSGGYPIDVIGGKSVFNFSELSIFIDGVFY